MKRNGTTPRTGCPAPPLTRLPWHEVAERMLDVHRLVLLVGEPGSGKTTFAREAARLRTGSEPEVLQGTPETELAHVWGFFALDGGDTRFSDGPLPRALRGDRHLVVEEFNLIPLEVRASLLALRGQDVVTNPFTGEDLAVPAAFRLTATSNPESIACLRSGKVAQALLDDFLVFEVPVLGADHVEGLLRREFPGASGQRVEQVLRAWKGLEQVDGSKDVETTIRLSYRAARHMLLLLEAGVDENAAAEIALANKYIVDKEAHASAKLRISLGFGRA